MRPQAKKVISPLLFIALVVISIVIVTQLVGRDNSSMLIDNGPTPTDDDYDDGLRTVGDDNESNANTTIYADDSLSTAPPTYAPTYLPTAANFATNAPSVKSATEQSRSPTLHPIASPPSASSSSYLPSRLPTKQPNEGTTNPATTSKPSRFPSIVPSQTPTKSPIITSEPDVDQTNEGSTSSLHHATDGCLKSGDTPSNTCVAADHTSAITVNCCSGSQSDNNLTCRRNGCFKTTSYQAAKDHCEREGMRLCSTTELASGACCGKGCGFNRQISWAADVCEPTQSPTKAPSQAPTASPTKRPTQSPTKAPTQEPTISPTKYPTPSPTKAPTQEPTSGPTKYPTQSPTTQTGTLVNFSSGDRSVGGDKASFLGLVFELQALRDLAITSLSTFTESDDKIWSEVWIRRGRYQGNTAGVAGWKRIYLKKSQQHGDIAPLDIVFDKQVLIPEGQIMSFYMLSPGRFLSDLGNTEGNVIAEDKSLRLYTGAAIDHGRWEDGCTDGRECIFPARTFNGAINYATSTMAPTSQPTPDPFIVQGSGLTLREEQWLDGHNVRRKKWHEMYGKKYRPLKWSKDLKDMAQAYADELASDCGATVHDSYANRGGYGENLASNTGFDEGAGSWGELKSVETVMTRFVERESTWAPPDNGHFTQVLWYATTHVGCADSTGTKSSGAVCRYQVCRYARAGNCSVKSFNDGSKEWWMNAVMQDSSSCQPFCPPEGC